MSRSLAISNTTEQFDNGAFFNLLERSVALPTESQATDSQPELYRYLNDFITPTSRRWASASISMTTRWQSVGPS